jgi:hypothetical protein
MTLSPTPGVLKRCRRTVWRFQQTFETPLKDLDRFVSTIFSAHGPPEKGCVTIDEVVCEPRALNALLAEHSIVGELGRDVSLDAAGRQEVEELLRSTLADWIDFLFIPQPKPYVIYADHDEFTTIYANAKGNLSKVVHALSEGGFQRIKDYERSLN